MVECIGASISMIVTNNLKGEDKEEKHHFIFCDLMG